VTAIRAFLAQALKTLAPKVVALAADALAREAAKLNEKK
jgi:hypothetical protein